MMGGRKLGRWMAAWLLAVSCATASAEVVDRTIAVVNKHLVTWSDLDEQMRFEALENERPLKSLTAADQRTAFNHLVQDWILRDQMQGMLPVSESDVDTRIAAIRDEWKAVGDDAKWAATLERYGLSAQELGSLVANQVEILRFLEFRVRPMVQVSRQEVDDYYSTTLVPQLKARGETPEPEDQLSAKILQVLEEQKMNAETDKWINTLRSQSHVQILWDGVR
jgi:peptidyl-prolyl cis-trans isomerase SurA